MKNKLVIVDVQKRKNLKVKNCDVIYLSTGKILTENCKIIKFQDFKLLNLEIFKANFLINLKKYLNVKKENKNKDFLIETEISNLRNDRTNFFDKIYFINCLKEIVKKYKFVEIIYDNNLLSSSYRSLKNKNITLENLDDNKIKSISLLNFIIIRIKFFLRSLIIVIFSKLFVKDQKIIKPDLGISLYPILYSKDQMNLYKKNVQLINFNITDETHIKKSLIENLKNIFLISKKKNLFIMEKKITIMDLVYNLLSSFAHFKIIISIKNKKFEIDGIDYSKTIFNYYLISYLNRLKLDIYKNSLRKIFVSNKIKNFHYFMFEYSFGFFLKNSIQNINSNISFIGYQHGIFSKNLWWFEFIKKYDPKKFLPQKIVANNKHSHKDYKIALKKHVKIFNCNPTMKKKFNIKFSESSKNYLIIIGQHDYKNILNIFLNNSSSKNFFIKAHPRSKPINFKIFKNLKKFNKNIKYKKVLFSQTTTLHYDFLNKNNYDKMMLIGYDYKNNILFDFIKKNKLFIF